MALQVIDYKGTKVLSDDGINPLAPASITGEGGAMLQEELLNFADRVTINDGLAHAQAHTAASHSDQTATGPELNTLRGGGNADALHTHV